MISIVFSELKTLSKPKDRVQTHVRLFLTPKALLDYCRGIDRDYDFVVHNVESTKISVGFPAFIDGNEINL